MLDYKPIKVSKSKLKHVPVFYLHFVQFSFFDDYFQSLFKYHWYKLYSRLKHAFLSTMCNLSLYGSRKVAFHLVLNYKLFHGSHCCCMNYLMALGFLSIALWSSARGWVSPTLPVAGSVPKGLLKRRIKGSGLWIS